MYQSHNMTTNKIKKAALNSYNSQKNGGFRILNEMPSQNTNSFQDLKSHEYTIHE